MRPRVAIVLSGYGVVPRGAEAMMGDLLPRLADRFEITTFSRSGQGPGGVARRHRQQDDRHRRGQPGEAAVYQHPLPGAAHRLFLRFRMKGICTWSFL